jgi:hypothetical protein
MKFIFICLLIANAFLFALVQGYLAGPIAETRQPQRLLQQENSQHLKLISMETAMLSTKGNAALACVEWGPFDAAELAKVEAKLNSLSFGNRASRQSAQDTATTVFIPSLGSKERAEKKAEELKVLGVNDFYIIQDQSDLRWAISLGVFKSEEAAKQLLARLVSKGVRSAKLGTRTVAKDEVDLVFKGISASEKASLDNLKKEFPTQELHACKGG